MGQMHVHQRIIEWFVLEGTLKIILFQTPAMGRDTFHQTRLLKALSNLALNITNNIQSSSLPKQHPSSEIMGTLHALSQLKNPKPNLKTISEKAVRPSQSYSTLQRRQVPGPYSLATTVEHRAPVYQLDLAKPCFSSRHKLQTTIMHSASLKEQTKGRKQKQLLGSCGS